MKKRVFEHEHEVFINRRRKHFDRINSFDFCEGETEDSLKITAEDSLKIIEGLYEWQWNRLTKKRSIPNNRGVKEFRSANKKLRLYSQDKLQKAHAGVRARGFEI